MAMQSGELGVQASTATVPWRAGASSRVASLTPFAIALLLPLLSQRYFGGVFAEPPSLMGIPLGVAVAALTLGWAALGAFVVWTTHSRIAAALALAFLTVPSILALLLGPAVILILQNLP